VVRRLDVNADHIRAGLGKIVDITLGLEDHEMHVHR
jgi:hypothetical protein